MRTHMLAAHGFCVVCIDSRGSDNRGMGFQAHLMNRMVSDNGIKCIVSNNCYAPYQMIGSMLFFSFSF